MDLDANWIVKRLRIAVEISEENKTENDLLKGKWIPVDVIKTIISDYDKAWEDMAEQHYEDVKGKEVDNEKNV
tara:strand:- start:1348 stop:1566 length:219 start_codon:yes stop_codon:yes gene_type:complete